MLSHWIFCLFSVTSTGNGKSIVSINGSLAYRHMGTIATDGFGNFVDERAEVLLISRNIVITGTDEPPPNDLVGKSTVH